MFLVIFLLYREPRQVQSLSLMLAFFAKLNHFFNQTLYEKKRLVVKDKSNFITKVFLVTFKNNNTVNNSEYYDF
jgi:hypothetical protein